MIPNPSSDPLKYRKRLVGLSLFIFFLFSSLIVYFFKIQIVENDKWIRLAKAQHQFLVKEPAKRGVFYSNDSIRKNHPGQPQAFVIDVPKFHFYSDPKSIKEEFKKEIAIKLDSFLQQKGGGVSKLLNELNRESRSRKLAIWLDKEEKQQLENWWFEYAKSKKIARNALFFVQDYKRSYPFGKLLGQVLHTIREEKDHQTQKAIPTGGLELIFDQFLQGKEGKRLLFRSPRHPLEMGQTLVEAEQGADVYLTINHYLQAVAEEGIEKAVKAANAKAGWAILMEPKSGEIWAIAQYPWFDPSDYRRYFNDSQLQDRAKVKAITDPYEPASTMKPLTLAIALKANQELKKQGKNPIFSPQEKIATREGNFPGRTKPISDLRCHSYLNMEMALQKSSNIYMARLVQRIIDTLGAQWYRNALKEICGFGKKTGIELPSESIGLLPTPGKLNPNGTMQWSTPTPFSIAFGHNILVTSLQMLRSYAILANGGLEVKPTLIKKIVRKKKNGTEEILFDQNALSQNTPLKQLLEPEIVKEVVRAMKYVTKPGGTAPKGDLYGYTEVGKTATSEKIVNGRYSKKEHISTFIGFAPVIEPRFVLLIAIDEPEFKYVPGLGKNQLGGNCCAPAFQEVGMRTLEYLGVEPDDPFGYPVGDPRRDEEKADWGKEIKRLAELYQTWNG